MLNVLPQANKKPAIFDTPVSGAKTTVSLFLRIHDYIL